MDEDNWPPDRRTYEAHLKAVRFLAGVDEGRWQVLQSTFPHLYVRVVAKDSEFDASATQDFHLVCDGYPVPGPFVERWDFKQMARPPAPTSANSSPGFCDALKDWSPGSDIHGGIYRGAHQRVQQQPQCVDQ